MSTSPTPLRPVKSKIPFKSINCDSFSVEEGGETYYPHVGETVELRNRVSLDDYTLLVEFQNDDGGPRTPELVDRVCQTLAARIKAWDWTDDDDVPYPSPPTPDVIRRLSAPEMMFLLSGGKQTAAGLTEAAEAERKND